MLTKTLVDRAASHGRASEGWQAGGTIYSFGPQASGQNQGAWSLKQPCLLTRLLHKYIMSVCQGRGNVRKHRHSPTLQPISLELWLSNPYAQQKLRKHRVLQQVVSASTTTPLPNTEHSAVIMLSRHSQRKTPNAQFF